MNVIVSFNVIVSPVALDLGEGATCDGDIIVLRATEYRKATC